MDKGTGTKTHADVFGSTALALNMTNTNTVSIGFNEGWACQEYVWFRPCNVNYPSGGSQSTLISGIYYLPYGYTPPGLSISSAVQCSVWSITKSCYYSPFESMWRSNPASVARGTQPPSGGATAVSSDISFTVASTLGLNAFVIYVDSDSVGSISVSWGGETVLSAKTMRDAGGCGDANYTSGTRFPVRCPTVRAGAENIVIAFTFGSWIKSVSLANN